MTIRIAMSALLWALAATLASCGGGGDGNATAAAQPADGTCPRFFVKGKAPAVSDERMRQGARTLCRRAFAVLHSGVVRQPLWAAEMLTEGAIKLGQGVPRVNAFHADEELDRRERAELSDYARSGYDRGHMAPDADQPSAAAAQEAMALSNMSPQRAGLNRNSWADLEGAVRRQTRGGPVYVVTGPLFRGATLATTHKDRRLAIPTHFFKAMYAEDRGAVVFIATNDERPRWETLTVDQFAKVHGIDPFPGLDPRFRTVNATLDGSLDQLRGAPSPGATGAPGGAAAGGDKLVRSPRSGQYMSTTDFRTAYGRDPTPEEYAK